MKHPDTTWQESVSMWGQIDPKRLCHGKNLDTTYLCFSLNDIHRNVLVWILLLLVYLWQCRTEVTGMVVMVITINNLYFSLIWFLTLVYLSYCQDDAVYFGFSEMCLWFFVMFCFLVSSFRLPIIRSCLHLVNEVYLKCLVFSSSSPLSLVCCSSMGFVMFEFVY